MNSWAVCAVLTASIATSTVVWSQEEGDKPARTSSLGVRQQRVTRMLEDLERKFKSLSVSLQETEPDRAKKLDSTLHEARRLLLAERMSKITGLLDQAQLESATSDQKLILADIRELLELLLDEQNDRDKAREEYERLAEFKRQIEEVLKQEREEKREADRLANKEDTLKALAAKIKAIEALIERQKELIAATEAARGEGVQAFSPLVPRQAEVRKDTEQVAQDMSREAGDKDPKEASSGEKSSGEKSFDSAKQPATEKQPSSGEGGESAGEGQPKSSEPKSSEPKSGEPKSGEPKSGEPKSGEPKSGEAKSGEAKSGQPSGASGRPAEPGEKSLRQAIQNQTQAEDNLQQGKGKAAQQFEQTALENLERSLAELKKESSRIASLPKEAFDKMAGKQDDITNQTAQISAKMEKGPQAGEQGSDGQGGSQGGSQGGNQQGGEKKPTPGQQKVQQAQQSMQKAAGDLRQQDPADASRQQGKAIKDLEEALREIEERLAQLREETQIEKLARLEARFREMLARQQQATADTRNLEKKRQESGGELKRTDRLAVAKVAAEELSLAEAAQQSLDIILDDGTSVVFADVVEQVRDDLKRVAQLLDAKQTDEFTTTLQKEVEITLEELIEALQEAQKQKEGGSGGGGGGGGGQEPLLPGSAELKLLRSAQLRINRRTAAIDSTRGDATELNEIVKEELQGLAGRQAEIGEMTVRILERDAGQ